MDEEQQEEQQQQEQPIASAAFTNLNITPAPRRPISTFSLFNRQALERDESISSAVKKNESAIKSINLTLVNVTGQVVNLSNSLNLIATKLQESSTLEKMKMDQERMQQQALADRNARRGMENNLERGIQAALFAPVRRIGAKTRFTLARLVTFFNTLLGGFLVMRAVKLIGALSTGNTEQLKNITDNIVKQLTAVGGIFLAINGGIALALRSITRLASFLTQVAVTNLLIKPIKLIFKIAKAAAIAIAGGMRGAPPVVPPNTNTNRPNQSNKNRNRGSNALALLANFGITAFDIAGGEDPGRAIAGGTGSLSTFLALNQFGRFLSKSPNPYARGLGYTLQFGSPILGELFGRPAGKQGFDLVRQTLGLEAITGGTGDIFNTSLDRVSQNNVNVNAIPITNDAPMSVEGRAALLMFAPPSNPNNPYVLNSYIQYNVIPV
tara:strand:+ start:107 stop:1423 length:1317 start_codon:yes stop_codon:yes gene_type:complete